MKNYHQNNLSWLHKNILSYVVFISIGICSVFYAKYSASFAELGVQFPFLDFPFFAGEFLLFFCLALLFLKFLTDYKNIAIPNKTIILIFLYILFFLAKAVYGYAKWGPLALRDAAFFYYPLFALVGYVFFDRELFNKKVVFFLVFIMFAMFYAGVYQHSNFPLLFLCLLLISILDNSWLRLFFLIILFLVIPYQEFFDEGRTRLISNTFGLISFFTLWCAIKLQIKTKYKILFGLFFVLLIVFLILKFGNKISVESISSLKSIKERLIYYDETIAIKKDTINFSEVKLFNPEDKNFLLCLKLKNIQEPFNKKDNFKENPPKEEGHPSLDNEQNIVQQSKPSRSLDTAYNNILFRIFIWRDMLIELKNRKPVFGFDFGYPLRSQSIQKLDWASGEWRRDGWITAHNSYLYAIYRGGIIGVFYILFIFVSLFKMLKIFIIKKSLPGIILISIFVYWCVSAFFTIFWEIPYKAILFWTLFGMTIAYQKECINAERTLQTF